LREFGRELVVGVWQRGWGVEEKIIKNNTNLAVMSYFSGARIVFYINLVNFGAAVGVLVLLSCNCT